MVRKRIANSRAMKTFAAGLAREVAVRKPGAHAKVIALVGDLGVGKTTFTQGFLKELGVRNRVSSPTFLIIKPHALRKLTYTRAFHIDCYRLKNPQELLSLGFKEILKNPEHIVLVEWPELIKKYLPRDTHWIHIKHPEKGTHRIVVSK